jgi:predicted esterase
LKTVEDPHALGDVLHYGTCQKEAGGVVVLIHGRGASAEDILGLAPVLAGPELKLTFLAPQAAGATWYPQSFLATREENEPYLSSALRKIETIVDAAIAAGTPRERIVIGGFSQGACLTSEFLATRPGRYAAGLAFTGGVIGPLNSRMHYEGDLLRTPVLLASGDPDPHVPWSRVEQTAEVLEAMNAAVTVQRYPGRVHTISQAEIETARAMIAEAFGG